MSTDLQPTTTAAARRSPGEGDGPSPFEVLTFSSGGALFCLRADEVQRVVGVERLQRNPAPEEPFGWLIGGTEDPPVFNLAQRLGLRPDDSPRQVLRLETTEGPWGLVVNEVIGTSTTDHELPLLPPTLLEEAVGGALEGLVHIAEEPRLLLRSELLHPQAAAPDRSSWRRRQLPLDRWRDLLAPLTAMRSPSLTIVPTAVTWEGSEVFLGLSATQVAAVEGHLPLLPVPGARSFVAGFVGWRGLAVTSVNLNRWLGFEDPPPGQPGQTVIATSSAVDEPVAISVPGEVLVERLPIRHTEPNRELPSPPSRLLGAFEIDAGLLLVPDLDTLLQQDS